MKSVLRVIISSRHAERRFDAFIWWLIFLLASVLVYALWEGEY